MKRGITLIEILITVTIFVLIIVTVYSAFYMGMKTWRRGQEGASLQKIRLGFLKMEKELKNSFFFSSAPFNGTAGEIVFPLTVSDEDTSRIYIITYAVEKDGEAGLKQLVRRERPFSEDMSFACEDKKIILRSMKGISFGYARQLGSEPQGFEWRDTWDAAVEGKLPPGVRISVETAGGQAEVFNKVIFLRQEKFTLK